MTNIRVAVIVGTLADPADSERPRRLPASDRAALELALRKFSSPVHAYAIDGDQAALRYALASGVAAASYLDRRETIDADVVLVGRGATGCWGDLLPALLAESLQAEMVLETLDVDPAPNGLRVTRDVGQGAREVLHVAGPVVLGMSEEAPQSLYVSHFRLQSADLSRIVSQTGEQDHRPGDATHADQRWDRVTPRVKAGDVDAKTTGTDTNRMNAVFGATVSSSIEHERAIIADAETCARHLLRYLKHHGFIERAAISLEEEPSPIEVETAQNLPRARHRRSTRRSGIPSRIRRGPRPLSRSSHGMSRRPRPLETEDNGRVSQLGKLSRIPRPVGMSVPQRVRGPFPVSNHQQSRWYEEGP